MRHLETLRPLVASIDWRLKLSNKRRGSRVDRLAPYNIVYRIAALKITKHAVHNLNAY